VIGIYPCEAILATIKAISAVSRRDAEFAGKVLSTKVLNCSKPENVPVHRSLGEGGSSDPKGCLLDMENSLGPIPRNQRKLNRPELKELFNGNECGDLESRNQIIFEAFKVYAFTQSEIAAHLGLHKTTISKIVGKTN
jgi:hypothetical protein